MVRSCLGSVLPVSVWAGYIEWSDLIVSASLHQGARNRAGVHFGKAAMQNNYLKLTGRFERTVSQQTGQLQKPQAVIHASHMR